MLVGSGLGGCLGGGNPSDDSTGTSGPTIELGESVPVVPTSDGIAYQRLVLHAGPRGLIAREWDDHDSLTLVRTDGTVLRLGGSSDRKILSSAYDAVNAPDGTYWVSDLGNRRLVHVSPDLTVIKVISTIAGQALVRPKGLAVVGDRIAVTDAGLGQVAVIDAKGDGVWIGNPLEAHPDIASGTHKWSLTAPGFLDHPRSIGGTNDGRLVVFDAAARRLTTFNAEGTPQSVIELLGQPTGFAVDPAGAFYVADVTRRMVNRIGDDGSETAVRVFDSDRSIELSSIEADRWQPYRLTWRRVALGDNPGLVVSLLPPIRIN